MSMFDYMKKPDTEDNPYAWSSQTQAEAKPSRTWPKVLRLVIEGALVILLVILVANLFNNTDDSGSGSVATESAEPVPEESGPAKDPQFLGMQVNDVVGRSGDILEVQGLAVSAAALVDRIAAPGDRPVLCSAVSLKNTADEALSYDSYNWNLQTPSGFIDYSSPWGSDNLAPSNGMVAAGGTISGDVCFPYESPETGQYVVLYTPTERLDYDQPANRAAWINNR